MADSVTGGAGTDGTSGAPTTGNPGSEGSEATSPGTTGESSSGTDPQIFDVGTQHDVPSQPEDCNADDLAMLAGEGEPPPCTDQAPPDSFDPVLAWAYPPPDSGIAMQSAVIPLVVNLGDDDGNGAIDGCDTPDVVLTVQNMASDPADRCEIHVLDGDYGETGLVHTVISGVGLDCTGTPAAGDIDGDGRAEIIAVLSTAEERLIAFDADGNTLWVSEPNPYPQQLSVLRAWQSGGVGLYDIDADGDVEVLFDHVLYDDQGHILWAEPDGYATYLQASTAADLDGDGRLEVITAFSGHAFDDDWNATRLWHFEDDAWIMSANSVPHVADVDDDPEPEVVYVGALGYFVVEHDGTYKWPAPQMPALASPCLAPSWNGYMRPGVIVDFDRDGEVELAVSACSTYAIYEIEETGMSIAFETFVQDASGGASGTAFDFLGNGFPVPLYSDETHAYGWAWDGATWVERFNLPRASSTWMEFPIVADIDDDGSADLLIVSEQTGVPALQVFTDAEHRWVQARRIWNQHAYSVTNVRENGTIPAPMLEHWKYFNSFRANAPIESGVPCEPAG